MPGLQTFFHDYSHAVGEPDAFPAPHQSPQSPPGIQMMSSGGKGRPARKASALAKARCIMVVKLSSLTPAT